MMSDNELRQEVHTGSGKCPVKTPEEGIAMTTDPGLLKIHDVQGLVRLSKRTLYRMIAARTFPAPIRPQGVRASLWRTSDVHAWLESQSGAAQ